MVDIFHPLQIKILDHIIVSGTGYTSMGEKGIVPYQSKDTANYEEIALGPIPAEERRNRLQNTHSR
jgi:DNA repair protein RadC